MFKSYKYRLLPNKEQQALLNKNFGNARWLYNYALDLSNKNFIETGKRLTRSEISKLLPQLKKEKEWLKKSNAQSLQVVVANLESSFNKFFKKQSGFPSLKKKNSKQSFTIPQQIKVNFNTGKVSIPKMKFIKVVFHRKFEGKIHSATISKTSSGKFYISFLLKINSEIPSKKPIVENQAIGLDVGIRELVTCSDGKKYENPRCYRKLESKLKRLNRWRSRKESKSKNRIKINVKIAILNERISNKRNDIWNKISTDLILKNDTICIEDLNIMNMLKNRSLSKSISDAGWGSFFNMLKYKAKWNGKNILEISQFSPSSKLCSVCGVKNSNLKLKQRVWTCSNGHVLDRDLNAAINIRKLAFLNIKIPKEIRE